MAYVFVHVVKLSSSSVGENDITSSTDHSGKEQTKCNGTKIQEKLFSCPHPGCIRTCSTKSRMAVHTMSHSGSGNVCNVRGKWPVKRNQLKNRRKLIQKRNRSVKPKNEKKKKSTSKYKSSLINKTYLLKCPECETNCRLLVGQRVWSYSEMMKEQLYVVCSNCQASFKTALKDGITSLTEEQRSFPLANITCCDKVFSFTKFYLAHQMTTHKADEVKCPECPTMLKNRTFMKRHWNSQHHKKSSSLCPYCGKTFYELRKRHLAACKGFASGIAPHIACDYCEKKFFVKTELTKHISRVHGMCLDVDLHFEQALCAFCGKCFASKYSLAEHMELHNEQRQTYPCKVCDKSYLSRHGLRCHMNSCHKGVTFECPTCSKVFKSQRGFQLHQALHDEKRKIHLCEFCSKSFKSKMGHKMHIVKHHGDHA